MDPNNTSYEECCSAKEERHSHHSEKMKSNLITRLNRIEGQIRGVKGLIEKKTLTAMMC